MTPGGAACGSGLTTMALLLGLVDDTPPQGTGGRAAAARPPPPLPPPPPAPPPLQCDKRSSQPPGQAPAPAARFPEAGGAALGPCDDDGAVAPGGAGAADRTASLDVSDHELWGMLSGDDDAVAGAGTPAPALTWPLDPAGGPEDGGSSPSGGGGGGGRGGGPHMPAPAPAGAAAHGTAVRHDVAANPRRTTPAASGLLQVLYGALGIPLQEGHLLAAGGPQPGGDGGGGELPQQAGNYDVPTAPPQPPRPMTPDGIPTIRQLLEMAYAMPPVAAAQPQPPLQQRPPPGSGSHPGAAAQGRAHGRPEQQHHPQAAALAPQQAGDQGGAAAMGGGGHPGSDASADMPYQQQQQQSAPSAVTARAGPGLRLGVGQQPQKQLTRVGRAKAAQAVLQGLRQAKLQVSQPGSQTDRQCVLRQA